MVQATIIPTQMFRGRISPPLNSSPGVPLGTSQPTWLPPVKKEYPFITP